MSSGVIKKSIIGHNGSISFVGFFSNESLLISSSFDGTIKIWQNKKDNFANKVKKMIRAHNDWIKTIAIHENGHFMVSGGDDY